MFIYLIEEIWLFLKKIMNVRNLILEFMLYYWLMNEMVLLTLKQFYEVIYEWYIYWEGQTSIHVPFVITCT